MTRLGIGVAVGMPVAVGAEAGDPVYEGEDLTTWDDIGTPVVTDLGSGIYQVELGIGDGISKLFTATGGNAACSMSFEARVTAGAPHSSSDCQLYDASDFSQWAKESLNQITSDWTQVEINGNSDDTDGKARLYVPAGATTSVTLEVRSLVITA